MDFRDTGEASSVMATDAIEMLANSPAHGARRRTCRATQRTPVSEPVADSSGAKRTLAARGDSKEVKAQLYPVEVDHARDALLTDFGKDTLQRTW